MEQSARDQVFKWRGVIFVPALLVIVLWSEPTAASFLRGGALIIMGEIIRFWAAGHIHLYRVSQVQAEQLVTSGPYSYVRNPLYWGNLLIGLGFSAIANWLPAYFIFLVFYALTYGAIIPLEEKFLREKFGEEYERYSEAVPRFVPKLGSGGYGGEFAGSDRRFSLGAAVYGEKYTVLTLLVAAGLFAVKLGVSF